MKNYILLAVASFITAVFLYLQTSQKQPDTYRSIQQEIDYVKRVGKGCSPDLTVINFADSSNFIPLLTGWGKYRMPVTFNNDSAYIYFQQGINMYYGFHIIEALASFEKALTFDKNFAMGYWGKALAYGPNINDFEYATAPDAIAAIKNAKELAGNCTPVEKALIDAMLLRYSLDTTQKRNELDQLYADAMKKISGQFAESADAAALYADALMVQHPWDLYDRFYEPKPWTPEIVRVLEMLVKKFPANPGASHYYIHAIEGSQHPEKGLEVANRLGSMMPGLAHLVHMPSHIYIRSGNYSKGLKANEDAIKGYYNYLAKYPVTGNNSFLYLIHNLHMLAACATMNGQYKKSVQFSMETKTSVDSSYLDAGGYFGMYSQYLYMMPYFTWVRFGKWDEILNQPVLPGRYIYAGIMQHFSRGLAYARKHKLDLAEGELEKFQSQTGHPQLKESPASFNPGMAAAGVAEKILQGVIAEEKGKLTIAVDLLKEAMEKENGMLYNEPRDWLLPARHYLGNALLKAKQYAEAEKVFRKDLEINPNNAWALTGLQKALTKLGKKNEVISVQQKLKKANSESDIKINDAVF